ncbi:CapA family protein [Shouchella patagoniensis]|uniref:CapA family protein n=1 Tax=Shouchella patagoniensis TaxID=228576 RepID=UPI0009952BD8|nr:CapA family protein [Shouchella patagoniensis]
MKFVKQAIGVFLIFLTTACQNEMRPGTTDLNTIELRFSTPFQKEGERFRQSVTVGTVGDILIHDRVYDDAKVERGFDFWPMLKEIAPYLKEPDITIANQETMIGGEEIGLSGYPSFNSPFEVGDALKKAGVDVVTLANNHTLDRGPKAIMNALSYWDELDMMYTGSFKDRNDADDLRVVKKNGLSIAILSYTYGINGIPVPDNREYLVNLADSSLMQKQIEEASLQADAVLVALHAGDEYVYYPNKQQKEWVQLAADSGATAVIGHHPHVLQPAEWIESEHEHDTLAIYSLGNFLSGQYDHPRRVGGVFSFELERSSTDGVMVANPRFLPTYVQFEDNDKNYRVRPMKDLTNEELPNIEKHLDEIETHMSQWLPELVVIKD